MKGSTAMQIANNALYTEVATNSKPLCCFNTQFHIREPEDYCTNFKVPSINFIYMMPHFASDVHLAVATEEVIDDHSSD
jgi:hypothetical protein